MVRSVRWEQKKILNEIHLSRKRHDASSHVGICQVYESHANSPVTSFFTTFTKVVIQSFLTNNRLIIFRKKIMKNIALDLRS